MTDKLTATAYLQVVPTFRGERVTGAKIERITQNHPKGNALSGCALVAVEVTLPASVFEPLLLARVSVDAEQIEVVPVVEVLTPVVDDA